MLLYLAVPYVSVRVTRGALLRRYTYVISRCRASRMTFISLSVSLWNDLADGVFVDGVRLLGFKSEPMILYYQNY